METVVIGEPSGVTMEINMTPCQRHKIVVNKYIEMGEVIGIGPFSDRETGQSFHRRLLRKNL